MKPDEIFALARKCGGTAGLSIKLIVMDAGDLQSFAAAIAAHCALLATDYVGEHEWGEPTAEIAALIRAAFPAPETKP